MFPINTEMWHKWPTLINILRYDPQKEGYVFSLFDVVHWYQVEEEKLCLSWNQIIPAGEVLTAKPLIHSQLGTTFYHDES